MKKRRIVGLVIALFLGVGALRAGAQVEREAPLHVSPHGSDTSPGTEDQPFATLSRARDAIRKKIEAGLRSDLTVFLREGRYFLEEPLVFGPEDSGTAEHAITYAAFPGERVLLSGGRRIEGWGREEGPVWSADLSKMRKGPWLFRQLFAGGRRLPRGRFPREGMLTLKEVSEDAKELAFEEAIPGEELGKGDAELVVLQNWSVARGLVVSSDGHSLRAATPLGYVGHAWTTACPGKRAYLENARAFMDEPGEWYLDRGRGKLFYFSAEGEDPEGMDFVAPAFEELLRVEGRKAAPVLNLHFQGITFAHAAWALPEIGYAGIQACHYGDRATTKPTFAVPSALCFTWARSCTLTGCRVLHGGAGGIGLGAGCRGIRIEGCEVGDMGGNGIMIGWRARTDQPPRQSFDYDWEDPEEVPAGNAVLNCHVHACGAQLFGAVGIFAAFSRDTRIAHNRVEDLPYTGISIGFRWDVTPTSQQGCVVEYNHILDVMRILADGGGIYTLGLQPGTVLRGNLIHDVHRSPYTHGGAPNNGIFFDQGSKGFLVEGNMIYNTSGQPIRFNQCNEAWHTWRDNAFSLRPGEEGFPEDGPSRAGLEPAFREALLGPDR